MIMTYGNCTNFLSSCAQKFNLCSHGFSALESETGKQKDGTKRNKKKAGKIIPGENSGKKQNKRKKELCCSFFKRSFVIE